MKMNFFLLFLGLTLLACSDSDDGYTIADWGGLSVVLSWDEAGKRNNEGIGLTLYDPEDILAYGGMIQ